MLLATTPEPALHLVRVEIVGAAADTEKPLGIFAPSPSCVICVLNALANTPLKVEEAERIAFTLFATSTDTPEIVYLMLIPETRRLRLEVEMVRAIALSLRAVSDSCALSVDLNDACLLEVNVVSVKPVRVIEPLTT